MNNDHCPHCGASATIAGTTSASEGGVRFRPFLRRGIRYCFIHMGNATGVELPEGFRACLSCGFVRGRLSPEKLRDFLVREKAICRDRPRGPEADV